MKTETEITIKAKANGKVIYHVAMFRQGKPNKDSLKTVSFAPIPLLSVWTLIAGSFPLEKK
ncbi:hypothetical protein [Bacteroides stercoris]|uniref:hypothetical protein n=1 Tax=Bacteroides stercoris TaxID=46506 RepID=UPI0034A5B24B|nr:hypothetical protein [Bacteroides stercoris]